MKRRDFLVTVGAALSAGLIDPASFASAVESPLTIAQDAPLPSPFGVVSPMGWMGVFRNISDAPVQLTITGAADEIILMQHLAPQTSYDVSLPFDGPLKWRTDGVNSGVIGYVTGYTN